MPICFLKLHKIHKERKARVNFVGASGNVTEYFGIFQKKKIETISFEVAQTKHLLINFSRQLSHLFVRLWTLMRNIRRIRSNGPPPKYGTQFTDQPTANVINVRNT